MDLHTGVIWHLGGGVLDTEKDWKRWSPLICLSCPLFLFLFRDSNRFMEWETLLSARTRIDIIGTGFQIRRVMENGEDE